MNDLGLVIKNVQQVRYDLTLSFVITDLSISDSYSSIISFIENSLAFVLLL